MKLKTNWLIDDEILITCNEMLSALKAKNDKLWKELYVKLKKLSKRHKLIK